jgi:hypothetical protein
VNRSMNAVPVNIISLHQVYFLQVFLMSKKRKMKHFDTDDVEKQEEKADTEDIYDDDQREEMLDEDEITASENAFMQGREQQPEKKKNQKQKTGHDDSVSVELAKDEYQED